MRWHIHLRIIYNEIQMEWYVNGLLHKDDSKQ